MSEVKPGGPTPEATQPQPQTQEQNRSFKDILADARKEGQGHQIASKEKWLNRLTSAKEGIKNAWNKTKETYKSVDAITRGLANNPDLRSEMKGRARDKMEEAKLKLADRYIGIRGRYEDKRDAAVDRMRQRLEAGKEAARDHMNSAVDRAKTVGSKVAEGAATGLLFAAAVDNRAFHAGAQIGRSLVESGMSVDRAAVGFADRAVNAGAQVDRAVVEYGMRKAMEWGGKLVDFYKASAQQVGENLRAEKNDFIAAYYYGEATVQSLKNTGSELLQKGKDKLADRQERKAAKAEQKRDKMEAKRQDRLARAAKLRGEAIPRLRLIQGGGGGEQPPKVAA